MSPTLDAIIMRCPRRRPEDRYASVTELTLPTPGTIGFAGSPSPRRRWCRWLEAPALPTPAYEVSVVATGGGGTGAASPKTFATPN